MLLRISPFGTGKKCNLAFRRTHLSTQTSPHQQYTTTNENALQWKQTFDEFGTNQNLLSPEDWYSLHPKTIKQNEQAYSIYKHKFQGSLYLALSTIYPNFDWCAWKFLHQRAPNGHWYNTANQRKFFEDLGKHLGIKQLDEWYHKLNKQIIIQHGGGAILTLHNSSPGDALSVCYPEHKWIPWKFKSTKQGFWKSPTNVSRFLSELSEKLDIKHLDDWYRVDRTQLYAFGASGFLRRSSFFKILQRQYPHHRWDHKKFLSSRKTQKWLAVSVKKLFPNEEILEDFQHPEINFPRTHRPMQLDVFIPSLSLAFEYQGEQHYLDIGVFQPSKNYQQRDEVKNQLCAKHGITLIEVPYWWNRTQKGLQDIIHQAKQNSVAEVNTESHTVSNQLHK